MDGFIVTNASLLRLCLRQSFLYLVWYTTMSILGHYNNFFFAAHLLDIAMGFKTLRTILSSVTHNGKQVRTRRMQVSPASSRGRCRDICRVRICSRLNIRLCSTASHIYF